MDGDLETRKMKIVRSFLMADIHATQVGITSSGAAVVVCLVEVGRNKAFLCALACLIRSSDYVAFTLRDVYVISETIKCSSRLLYNILFARAEEPDSAVSISNHHCQCRRFTYCGGRRNGWLPRPANRIR